MTKKKITVLSVSAAILVLAVIAGILALPYCRSNPLFSALGCKPEEIAKIESFYLTSEGKASAEFTDPEEIQQFLACFSEIQIKRKWAPAPSTLVLGPSSEIRFYDKNNNLILYFSYSKYGDFVLRDFTHDRTYSSETQPKTAVLEQIHQPFLTPFTPEELALPQ